MANTNQEKMIVELLAAHRRIRSITEEGNTPDTEKLDRIHKIADAKVYQYEDFVKNLD